MRHMQARLALVAMIFLSVIAVGFALWNRPQPEVLPAVIGPIAEEVVSIVSPPSKSPATTSVAPAATVLPAETALVLRGSDISASGETPEVCLIFNIALDSQVKDWSSFVVVQDSQKPSFRLDGGGRRLCLGGLQFGSDIPVTLRSGLPAADGKPLAAEAVTVIRLKDRDPVVEFGPGLFLPRESGVTVPVTTVNVKQLDLALYRAGERILSQFYLELLNEREFNIFDPASLQSRDGEKIWSGRQAVDSLPNAAVVSSVNLEEALKNHPPGIYLLMAAPVRDDATTKDDNAEDDQWQYRREAGQWIIISDIGLSSFEGENGLTVVARSFRTAQLLPGVAVRLVARNNEILSQQTTDANGIVRFDAGLMRGEGGNAPTLVVAHQADGSGLTLMDLRRSGFDLSDRGVAGRPAATSVDPFLYTDRGIYRPGETVQLVALMRDAEAVALPERGATVRLYRPNGMVYRDYALTDTTRSGALSQAILLPKEASRGTWRVALRSGGSTLGDLTFEVQDFVPQLLALSFNSVPEFLVLGQKVSVPLDVRFLYGAPAADLDGEITLKVVADPTPFPRFKEFSWGKHDGEFESLREDDALAATDSQGRTTVETSLPQLDNLDRPVKAEIRVSVNEPGGRATWDDITLPIRSEDVSVGVRSVNGPSIGEGVSAAFEVITVDRLGKPLAQKGLEWSLVRLSNSWQWFRRGSGWSYERIERETVMATGQIGTGADGLAQLQIPARNLTWGEYRLRVKSPVSMTSEAMLDVGWFHREGNGVERPDRLVVAADKAGYNPGEVAKLRIESDFDGQGQLVVANHKILSMQTFNIAKGGTTVEVPIGKDWGAGAYALISSYRPLDGTLGRAPVRSVGVAWLGLAPAPRTLTVALETPEMIVPRQTLTVPVQVTAERPLKQAYVTLAAVDQGILQLTRFATPNPVSYYLGQRRLGVTMRDDYGRLIRNDLMGLEGQGGDGDAGLGGKGLDVVPTRTVALFSGLVPLDEDGRAKIPLEIPDFQGELRLMAVAYDTDGVGSIGKPLTVRDPVVADLFLPRFLSPGDRAFATLVLHNVSGAAGDYTVTVKGDAVASITLNETETLNGGQKLTRLIPLAAGSAGIADLSLAVKGPDFAVTRNWPIQVRPWQLPISVRQTKALPANGQVQLALPEVGTMLDGSVTASASVSRWAGLDVAATLMALDRYPFGCLEQTVSRALPLLYFNDLAESLETKGDAAVPVRIQEAIDKVLSMQQSNGAFSMWQRSRWSGDEDNRATDWVSDYALDFLQRAAAKGYDVPSAPLQLGQKYLKQQAGRSSAASSAAGAYAQWLLARSGAADAADLRYIMTKPGSHPLLVEAFFAAALDATGDRALANQAWKTVLSRLESVGEESGRIYGSALRDLYIIASLLADVGRSEYIPDVLGIAAHHNQTPSATTTQEKGWMILTAAALAQQAGPIDVTVDGKEVSGRQDPLQQTVSPAQAAAGVTVSNRSAKALFATLAADGVPVQPLPPENEGITISKTFLSLDGKTPLPEPLQLSRNQRAVVLVEGEMLTENAGELAVLDLLPAGLEIEGILTDQSAGYADLNLSNARVQEKRDDRYVGVVNLPHERVYDRDDGYYRYCDPTSYNHKCPDPWKFRFAYVVRAVTPGQFTLPAAKAEAMYTPSIWGRTGVSSLTVVGE